MADRHIIAIGGLLPEGNNAPLVDYGLKLCASRRPALGYLPTASGDAERYRQRFAEIAGRLDCKCSTLTFFERTPDVAAWVAAQDMILVGGGNTRSMLAVWRDWGLPSLLAEAWRRGTVLAGWSAGAICWFDQGVTDSWAGRLESLECLGFLRGSCCPHFSGESDRRPAYQDLLRGGRISPGIAIDDGAAVHFVEERPETVLTLLPDANAYRLTREDDQVSEQPLPVDRVLLRDEQ